MHTNFVGVYVLFQNVHVPYFDKYNMHPILARKGENLVWLYYTDTL